MCTTFCQDEELRDSEDAKEGCGHECLLVILLMLCALIIAFITGPRGN